MDSMIKAKNQNSRITRITCKSSFSLVAFLWNQTNRISEKIIITTTTTTTTKIATTTTTKMINQKYEMNKGKKLDPDQPNKQTAKQTTTTKIMIK